MKKERKIINTNIRLNLMNEQDRQAWNYLRGMDRKKYKSYTKAVVLALNDYFSRQEQIEADPYLETRKKEDEFLNRVEEAVERGARQSMPLVLAGNLLELLKPVMVSRLTRKQWRFQSKFRNSMKNVKVVTGRLI